MKKLIFLSLLSIFLLVGCGQMRITSVEISENGLFSIFPEGSADEDGELINAETSAVFYDGENFIIANDKAIPLEGYSAVFTLDKDNFDQPKFLTQQSFLNGMKYESMTATLDKKFILLATGFDRVKSDSSEWNSYNTLLAWESGKPETVHVVSASTADGITSSVELREFLDKILNAPYYKLEGLAVMPDNKLVFGTREIGEAYDDFSYLIKLISVSYEIKENKFYLKDDWELIYEYDPANLGVAETVGLSSLEYDPYTKSLLMLTSFESEGEDADLGAYLWELPLDNLKIGEMPKLIKKIDGSPLLFAHKAEGLTIIDKDTLFIIHDDDRVYDNRKHNQAAYSLINLKYE